MNVSAICVHLWGKILDVKVIICHTLWTVSREFSPLYLTHQHKHLQFVCESKSAKSISALSESGTCRSHRRSTLPSLSSQRSEWAAWCRSCPHPCAGQRRPKGGEEEKKKNSEWKNQSRKCYEAVHGASWGFLLGLVHSASSKMQRSL